MKRHPSLKRGPYRAGERAYLSNYPMDYSLQLLDGPRLYRTGTVQMCGPNITWMKFDDGEQLTVKTSALNKGEPPNDTKP